MVEITYLAIAGIALAAMFFGYGFGLFEGRSQGYKKRKKEEEREKQNQLPSEPEIVTQTVTETVTVEDPGLLRVKNEGGAYTLDLDGQRVNPVALPPEQRKRLIEILNIMRPWLEGRAAPPPPPAPAAFRPASSAPLMSGQPASSPPPVAPSSPVSISTSQESPRREAPLDSKPVDPKAAATGKKEEKPVGSIVMQIDSILQARLQGTPLERRGVYLSESPYGEVNVFIGTNRYNSVEEISDPEVKAAIRAAIKEWEDKYTPGLA